MSSPPRPVSVVHRPADADLLARAGLLDFDRVMTRADGVPVKAKLAARQVHRLDLDGGVRLFLKRYFAIPLASAARDRALGRGYDSGASREWRALGALASLGVPAPRAVAYGEERRGGLVRRAFLVTEGIEVEGSLESWLCRGPLPAPSARRRVARRLAELLRRMHEGGVHHRDFYLGHVAYRGDGAELFVMDLNRADVRRRVTRRWRVKDVAALHFSTPRRLVAVPERLRFLAHYLPGRLRDHRPFLAAVDEKAAGMLAHVRRQVARRRPNFHVNE